MLEFLVGLMLYAFWMALIINFVILFSMRLYYVAKEKKDSLDIVKILFIPFSIGYLSLNNRKTAFDIIYKIFMVLMLLCIVIGGIMVFYTHFG